MADDDVRIETDGYVLIRLATDWLNVPEPLASLLAAYVVSPPNTATAAKPKLPLVLSRDDAGSAGDR